MNPLNPLTALDATRFETTPTLKKMAAASRRLAELKGLAATIPNQGMLINTLGMQEAKDSSAIENIVTTHDQLFRADAFPRSGNNPAAKEVLRYRRALRVGFEALAESGLLICNDIVRIQAELECNKAGLRSLAGTKLLDGAGQVVYTPLQDHATIVALMTDLEQFINTDERFEADPLIKMTLLHHQFESIHPFYDANGRTGRILNVLYLVQQKLLDIPVLYLSRHILHTKSEYYRLLQAVREHDAWEEWVLYMLTAVEETSVDTIATISAIRQALLDAKRRIRAQYKFYSQDLINNLFTHPYTKIEFIESDLQVSRLTATRYLEALTEGGFLQKQKVGRSNYYINIALTAILTGEGLPEGAQ